MGKYHAIDNLDKKPGTYVLVMQSKVQATLQVGRLGVLQLRKGYYLYVGSAFGSGGLRSRLARHGCQLKKPHWHIDYLRAITTLRGIWYSHDVHKREELWVDVLSQVPALTVPLKGFGASDSKSKRNIVTHLYFSQAFPSVDYFRRIILGAVANHATINELPCYPLSDCVSDSTIDRTG